MTHHVKYLLAYVQLHLSTFPFSKTGLHPRKLESLHSLYKMNYKSLSQSCVSSGSSMLGLMATSSRRAYATPKSAAPRAPAPPHTQKTLKHSSVLWM